MSSTELLLVPNTGELLDLQALARDELATLALSLRDYERDMARARRRVENELISRMHQHEHRVEQTPSGFTLELYTGHSRAWDADDLEEAVRDLVDQGVIHAGQYRGLIRHERKVDGRIAQRLLNALTGTARATIEACFTWKTGEPSIKIKPPSPLAIDATAEDDA